MKQRRQRIGNPSIWHRMPKGVRAGNSPVWQGDDQYDFDDKKASENISKIYNKKCKKCGKKIDYSIAGLCPDCYAKLHPM